MSATRCPTCNESFGLFRWRHHCYSCQRVSCSACLTPRPTQDLLTTQVLTETEGDGYCPVCMRDRVEPFLEKYRAAVAGASSMQHWPRSYQGRIPRDAAASTRQLVTRWRSSRGTALEELLVTAAYHGYELVYDVTVEHQLERRSEPSHNGNGTHYYNVPQYQARGVAAKASRGPRARAERR